MAKFVEDKINQSINDRKELNSRFIENCSTYNSFLQLEKKAFQEGKVPLRYKELMALSISIVTKCEPCIEWHVQQAYLAGASDQEIYETIDIAIEMGGGPAAAYSRFALDALDFHKKNSKL